MKKNSIAETAVATDYIVDVTTDDNNEDKSDGKQRTHQETPALASVALPPQRISSDISDNEFLVVTCGQRQLSAGKITPLPAGLPKSLRFLDSSSDDDFEIPCSQRSSVSGFLSTNYGAKRRKWSSNRTIE